MPTVLVVGSYRFFFYSRENAEPAHIHVESGDRIAKYWLEPVELGIIQAVQGARADNSLEAGG